MSWRFWIDRGGTFTDVVARRPDGAVLTHKLLSTDPERYDDAAVAGIRALLGVPAGSPIPPGIVEEVRLGTTVATNALLERRGARTALVITQGFTDALTIGYQNRPHIFARRIERTTPPAERVIALDERVAADGTVLRPPDLPALRTALEKARADGIEAVAVVALHAPLHPAHEAAAAALARSLGFAEVAASAEVSPLRKLVPRGDTTLLDAYLSPGLRRYVDSLAAELPGVRLLFMRSTGGLTDSATVRGKDAVLSGPAGGIVGMARSSAAAGFGAVIGFDMGGTSTDVSHYAGTYERVTESEVAGTRLQVPMLDISTVAAGGGSILRVVDGRYRVGPESAGAHPGPACYRRGGPATVTDANVVLGRVSPAHFPAVFGPAGDQPLDADAAHAALLSQRMSSAASMSVEELAAGFLAVAVDNMANAIRRITVAKGRDLSRYALTTFGGAGGQHACAVADALGVTTVLVPPLAGLLSAVGIGLADLTARRTQAVEQRLLEADLRVLIESLAAEATAELVGHGVPAADVRVERIAHLRYDGTDTLLEVPLADAASMTRDFIAAHEQTYAFRLDRPLVVGAVTVEATASSSQGMTSLGEPPPSQGMSSAAETTVRMYAEGAWHEVPLVERAAVVEPVTGPALIVEDGSTTVVEPGWTAETMPTGHLVLRRLERRSDRTGDATVVHPVRLEIFANLFASIAEQMGARLRATAQSVNIAERLDFSCAVFDAAGHLIANAPHMPVHLGSMGASVTAVVAKHGGAIRAGDVYVVNDPYRGGTHLPDVTVVSPVFPADLGPAPAPHVPEVPLFFVASRGHHAEIGGISPGSMPADSRTLDEEGIRFDAHLLVRGGEFDELSTRQLLTSGPYPSRAPEVNLADLRAQVAANTKGAAELTRAVHEHGLDVVAAYMDHVQDNAADAVRRVIDALDDGAYRYEMDCGAVIAVQVTVDRAERTATLDFTGSSPQRADNFNAPSSVVTAAALYVFRTLVGEDIPINHGCLRPLRLVIPPDSMLAPTYPAAVVAGNVETSQAITGALYAALGVAAEGSGTMNNVSFGNARAQYYETVASGSGAGPDFDGTDVVQTHMTNSRLTDPEVLEARFPVLVEEFSIRRGSGGGGAHRGGDGAVRRLRFTEAVSVSLLSSHRRIPPYGMAGGEPGALGSNALERADGSRIELGGSDRVEASPGDVLVITTPGGGGYGHAPD
ncbi:hydantoinase B/oxoprolinase family protein [Sporichthya sp.]|uniref:hydantoinase B/oxoprolinase family protein n=1 Tax=Sporichthya sp. TaxID=65475 RepID=UPI0025EFEBFE|nr:hydantoinase B/oxoprolinase family protein [Sporichthya sp.]